MVTTDSTKFRSGSTKLNFVCAKRVFSLLVSPALEKFTENLICEEIILKMNIPIFDRQCETISIGGIKTEAVGYVKTTVQCLSKGVQAGTTYLKARVVRDFYKHFGADGLCSEKLRSKLKHTEPSNADEEMSDAENTTVMKKIKKVKSAQPNISQKVPKSPHLHSQTSPASSHAYENSVDHNPPPSFTRGQHSSSTPKRKMKADNYSNKSVIIHGKKLSPDQHRSYDRYAYFHLGRPIPSELWNVPMPHGRNWCNPCCMQDSNTMDDCGYFDYVGRNCGLRCPGKFCDHNIPSCVLNDGQCAAPPEHMLHVYHDVVDQPDPHPDETHDVDGTPPSSPPPSCQGNYIQYNVLNPIPWQRSPGGGQLKKWVPWYYDRRTHEYSYTVPEDFDPDGSFHSVRTMDSLASSFNGSYATDGSNLYKLEDTGPTYFLQPGWDDHEAKQLQSSSQPTQHLQPGWDDSEASHLQSSSQLQHLQPGWDDIGARQQQSSQDQQYTSVDQATVHKLFLNGQNIPADLAHVPQPHGERWCHPDCPLLGSEDLPYECGYHPDWGNIAPCSQTCPGGYCPHTRGSYGGDWVQQGLFGNDREVDQG